MPLPLLLAALATPAALPAAPAVPAAVVAHAPAAAGRSYVVRPGDTLTSIARAHRTTIGAIVRANRLRDPHHVLVGTRLVVPGPATTSAASAGRTTVSYTSTARTTAKASPTTRAGIRSLIASTARAHGVDPQLAIAIGYQESGWTQSVRSSVGAVGVMQIMPANEKWLSGLAGRDLDIENTRDNITAGVVMLRYLTRHAPSLDHAIGGYYQGLPSIMRRGAYDDTIRYIASVKALMRRL